MNRTAQRDSTTGTCRRDPTTGALVRSGPINSADCCCNLTRLDCEICHSTCATVVLADVAVCPDLDCDLTTNICRWTATGDPNGTYELPHCLPTDAGGRPGVCIAAESFCDVLTFQELGSVGGHTTIIYGDVLNIYVQMERFQEELIDGTGTHTQIFYFVTVYAEVDSDKLNCCYAYGVGDGLECRCHARPDFGGLIVDDQLSFGPKVFVAGKMFFDDCPVDSGFTVNNGDWDHIEFDAGTGLFSIVTGSVDVLDCGESGVAAGGSGEAGFTGGTATVTLHTTPDVSCPARDCTCSNEGGRCDACQDIDTVPAYWTATFNSVANCTDLCPPEFPACDLRGSTADLTSYTLQQTLRGCSWVSPVCSYTVTHCDDSPTTETYAITLTITPGLIRLTNGFQTFELVTADGINCAGASYVLPLAAGQPTSCGDSTCAPFIAGSVTITPGPGPDPCGASGSCSVDCLVCGHNDVSDADCLYCPTDTHLTITGSISWGVCDDCDGTDGPGCFPPTGDGCGCCVLASDIDCAECGPPPPPGPPPPAVPCVCGGPATSHADCTAANGVWCCTGGGDGISTCNWLTLEDIEIDLPLTAHDSTTQTFELTVGSVHWKVIRTCGVAMVADVFDVTVTVNGHCKAHGIIGGGCTGFGGSVFTTDTTLSSTCGGGGGALTGVMHSGNCDTRTPPV